MNRELGHLARYVHDNSTCPKENLLGTTLGMEVQQ